MSHTDRVNARLDALYGTHLPPPEREALAEQAAEDEELFRAARAQQRQAAADDRRANRAHHRELASRGCICQVSMASRNPTAYHSLCPIHHGAPALDADNPWG